MRINFKFEAPIPQVQIIAYIIYYHCTLVECNIFSHIGTQDKIFRVAYRYSKFDIDYWEGYIDIYNMTVWILARNDINFSMAAGLIRLHMPGVK